MVSKRDGQMVLWTRYFDADLTRREGRRVAKEKAVSAPRAGHIAEAAKSLGLKAVLEKEAGHPTEAWRKEGRVLVSSTWTKEETIRRVADRL